MTALAAESNTTAGPQSANRLAVAPGSWAHPSQGGKGQPDPRDRPVTPKRLASAPNPSPAGASHRRSGRSGRAAGANFTPRGSTRHGQQNPTHVAPNGADGAPGERPGRWRRDSAPMAAPPQATGWPSASAPRDRSTAACHCSPSSAAAEAGSPLTVPVRTGSRGRRSKRRTHSTRRQPRCRAVVSVLTLRVGVPIDVPIDVPIVPVTSRFVAGAGRAFRSEFFINGNVDGHPSRHGDRNGGSSMPP